MQDNFYVTLPSNSSMRFYPNNSLTNYHVKLPKPITLNGEFEAALVEIHFSRSWFNIVDDKDGQLIVIDTDGNEDVKFEISVSRGLYKSPEELVTALNITINDLFFGAYREKIVTDSTSVQRERDSYEKTYSKEIAGRGKLTLDVEYAIKSKDEAEKQLNAVKEKVQNIAGMIADSKNKFEKDLAARKSQLPALENESKKYEELSREIRDLQAKRDKQTADENLAKERARVEEEGVRANFDTMVGAHADKVNKLDRFDARMKGSRNKLDDLENRAHIGSRRANARMIAAAGGNYQNWFVYERSSQKVAVVLPPRVSAAFSSTLQRMLGLEANFVANPSLTDDLRVEASANADLATRLNTLFIYSDCIEYQYVGDKLAPLLREIHLDDRDGLHVTKTFTHPFYRPVSRNFIQSIEIDIRDGLGRAVQFVSGDTVVSTLHFRPRA